MNTDQMTGEEYNQNVRRYKDALEAVSQLHLRWLEATQPSGRSVLGINDPEAYIAEIKTTIDTLRELAPWVEIACVAQIDHTGRWAPQAGEAPIEPMPSWQRELVIAKMAGEPQEKISLLREPLAYARGLVAKTTDAHP